jgi:hypothetical protein
MAVERSSGSESDNAIHLKGLSPRSGYSHPRWVITIFLPFRKTTYDLYLDFLGSMGLKYPINSSAFSIILSILLF